VDFLLAHDLLYELVRVVLKDVLFICGTLLLFSSIFALISRAFFFSFGVITSSAKKFVADTFALFKD
jgi:hypothetical protein